MKMTKGPPDRDKRRAYDTFICNCAMMILQARWIVATVCLLWSGHGAKVVVWGQACRHWRQTQKQVLRGGCRGTRHLPAAQAYDYGLPPGALGKGRKKDRMHLIKDRFRAAREYRGELSAALAADGGDRLIRCPPSRIWTASPAAAYTTSAACPLAQSVLERTPLSR